MRRTTPCPGSPHPTFRRLRLIRGSRLSWITLASVRQLVRCGLATASALALHLLLTLLVSPSAVSAGWADGRRRAARSRTTLILRAPTARLVGATLAGCCRRDLLWCGNVLCPISDMVVSEKQRYHLPNWTTFAAKLFFAPLNFACRRFASPRNPPPLTQFLLTMRVIARFLVVPRLRGRVTIYGRLTAMFCVQSPIPRANVQATVPVKSRLDHYSVNL